MSHAGYLVHTECSKKESINSLSNTAAILGDVMSPQILAVHRSYRELANILVNRAPESREILMFVSKETHADKRCSVTKRVCTRALHGTRFLPHSRPASPLSGPAPVPHRPLQC